MLHNGMVSHRATDLFIEGRGIHFELTRRYNSKRTNDISVVGWGWEHSYDQQLIFDIDPATSPTVGARLQNGNNRIDSYSKVHPSTEFLGSGLYTRLYQDGSDWVIRARHGSRSYFEQTPSRALVYRLKKIRDANGNEVHLEYFGTSDPIAVRGLLKRVIDTLGREVAFEYDTSGPYPQLITVTDFMGREVVYGYDSAGNLETVRSPTVTSTTESSGPFNNFPTGRMEKYTYYSGTNRLKDIIRPNEVAASSTTPTVSFTYYDDGNWRDGWAETQTLGYGTITYDYQSEPGSPTDPSTDVIKTTVTDRMGNVTVYRFNGNGNAILKQEDSGTTSFTYNGDGEITTITRPRGNVEFRTYDTSGTRFQHGNLLSIEQTAGSVTPTYYTSTSITTHFSWEPVFNQPRYQHDPRGGSSSSAYRTEYVCDYMEGSADASSPNDISAAVGLELGMSTAAARILIAPYVLDADLNGDGLIGSPGVAVQGNIVQRILPTVTLAQTGMGTDHQATAEGDGSQQAIRSWTYNPHGQITSETDPEENVTVYLYTPSDDINGDGVDDFDSGTSLEATGGYLRRVVEDTALPYTADSQLAGVNARSLPTDIGRNSAHAVAVTNRTIDFVHDRAGRLLAQIDARGVRTEFAVNELDEVWKIRRGTSTSAASTRQGGSPLETLESHIVGTSFDYEEKLLRDHNGNVIRKLVENSGETPDTGDYAGYWETAYEYDRLDNVVLVKEEKAAGTFVETETIYDSNENVQKVIQPLGNYVRYERDDRDRVLRVFRGGPLFTEAKVEEREYDGNNNLLERVDGNTKVTTFSYDEFDRLRDVQDPQASRREFHYDPASNPVSVRDFGAVNGVGGQKRQTDVMWDERSRPFFIDRIANYGTLVEGPLAPGSGIATRVEYDRLSRRTFVIGDDAQAHETRYDGLDRAIWTRDPMGNIREGSYDDESNLVKTIETDVYPSGAPTRTFWTWRRYDALGRLITTTNQLGETDRFEYDARDLLIATSDAEAPGTAGTIHGVSVNSAGNTRSYRYDGLGNLLRETIDLRVGGNGAGAIDTSNTANADGKVVLEQSWDANGRLFRRYDDKQSGTSGNGTFTQYDWDALDRITKETFADLTYVNREWDRVGNLTAHVDARGNRVEYGYDHVNRLTSMTLTDGPALGATGMQTQTFEYDGLGRRTLARNQYFDGTGVLQLWEVERTWDALDRILTESQNGRVVANEWKEESKRTNLHYATITPGMTAPLDVSYVHDALDRVTTIKTNGNALAGYTYAGPDRKHSRSMRNRQSTRWHDGSHDDTAYYDGAKRITKIDHYHLDSSSLLGSFEHTYNRVGSRKFELRVHDDHTNNTSTTAGVGDNYVHDSLYRLVRVERDVPAADVGTPNPSLVAGTRDWMLDGVHNWAAFEIDSTTHTSTMDVMHQYGDFGPVEPEYDDDGNLTLTSTLGAPTVDVHLHYDALNRLVLITNAEATSWVSHEYDAEGRRVRTLFHNVTGTPLATEYVHDGWEVIEEHNLTAPSTWVFIRRFIMGTEIDEPICLENLPGQEGARTLYYMLSTLGHVVGLSNNVGNVVERYEYDAYGAPRFHNADNTVKTNQKSNYGNPYYFTGRRYEPWILPVYEFRNRFYLPEQGRFVQRDPIGLWTDILSHGNATQYASSAPWDNTDRLGTEILKVGGTIWEQHKYDADTTNGPHWHNKQTGAKYFPDKGLFQDPKTGKWSASGAKWDKKFKLTKEAADGIRAKKAAKALAKAAKKAAGSIAKKVAKKAGGAIVRKVPLLGIVFFVSDTCEAGVGHATNEFLWPLSEIWTQESDS